MHLTTNASETIASPCVFVQLLTPAFAHFNRWFEEDDFTSPPPLCYRATLVALECLHAWEMTDIRQENPALMRQLFKFFASPTTVEQLHRFQEAAIPCQCDLSGDSSACSQALHESEIAKDEEGQGPLENARRLFFCGVKLFDGVKARSVLSRATQRCRSDQQQKKKTKKQENWPSHPSELLPFGPQRFVVATRAWLTFLGGDHPEGLLLFWKFLTICPSLFTELLVHPELVQDICTAYMASPDRAQAFVRDGAPSRVLAMMMGLNISLFELLDCPPSSRAILLPAATRSGLERAARRLLSILPELSGHTSEPGQAIYTSTKGLHKALNGSCQPESMVEYGHFKGTCGLHHDPFHCLDMAWIHFLDRSQCSGPECLRTIESEQSCAFGACSGCGVLRFCSKLCQERCWKEKDHRKFCRELGRFKELRRSSASSACCKSCLYLERAALEFAPEHLRDWAEEDLVSMLGHLEGLRLASDEALVASIRRAGHSE